jgi:glycerol-3-phosphate dehydrogenase (NAD(P)+)
MLAEEIMENKIALGIVATKTDEMYSALSDIFARTHLSLGFSPHVEEIALLGVLKNIYTLAVGISTEFKKSESSWGDNAHGYIISKCIQEMHDIFNEKQLNTQVIKTIAGIGDFITTSSSIHSSNCVAGMQLARGEKPKKCEGIRSLDLLNNKIPIHEYPLLNSLHKIIYAEGDPYSTIKQTVAI